MLVAATVLAVALPGVEASPEPTKLNIKNLIPESYREKYQRKILDLSEKAQAKQAEQKVTPEPLERTEVVEAPKRVVQAVQAPVGDCYEAVRATWPQSLWPGAYTVMEKESGARSNATGTINYDGSQDFGCFQINNFAHKGFFQSHDWADPYQNAAYGYQIYLGRHSFSAWYATKGVLW